MSASYRENRAQITILRPMRPDTLIAQPKTRRLSRSVRPANVIQFPTPHARGVLLIQVVTVVLGILLVNAVIVLIYAGLV